MNRYNVRIQNTKFWMSKKIHTDYVDFNCINIYPKINQKNIKGLYKGDIINWDLLEFPKEYKKVKKLCSAENLKFKVTKKTYGWEGVTLYIKEI